MRNDTCLPTLFTAFLLCCAPAVASQFNVGDRVDADVTHIGIWKPGVISEVLPFNRYRVHLDEDKVRGYESTVCLEQFIRSGSAASSQNATGQAGSQSGKGSAPGSAGTFKVGDRVSADVTHLGKWQPGVVTEVLPFDRYRVLLDEDKVRGYESTVVMAQYIQAGGAAATTNNAASTFAPPNTVAPGSTPAKSGTHSPPARTPAPQAAKADGLPAGKGHPPDGVYVAQKMSPGGSYIGLGELVIRGNTYKGIAGGGFAPFSISGGNITWSAGIVGMPDNWVLRHSVYRGLDDSGHPYIQVYYVSKNKDGTSFNDCFDCVKEK